MSGLASSVRIERYLVEDIGFIVWGRNIVPCCMSRGMYDEIEGEKCDGYGLEEGEEFEGMCYNGLYCGDCMCKHVGMD